MPFHSLTEPTTAAAWIAPQIRALLGRSASVRRCEVLHARRRLYAKPESAHRSYVEFCYRLALLEAGSGEESTEIVSGRGYLQRPSDSAATALGRPVLHPHLHVYVRRFPDDAALPCLQELTAARAVTTLPEDALRRLHHPEAVRVQIASYRPGERCVLRFSPAPQDEVPARQPSVYAKCYSLGHGAQVAASYRTLATAIVGASLPDLLHFDDACDVLWLAGIDGPLAADCCDGPHAADTARQLGRATAALHATHGVTAGIRDRALLLEESVKRLEKLALALPCNHPVLVQLAARLADDEQQLPPSQRQTIHGDLHLRQWVMADGRAYLVDFDELVLGDAEQDLASLVVDMELHPHARAGIAGLLHAYARRAHRPLDPALLQWHYRVQLIAKAYRLYWRFGAMVQADMLALLARATAEADFQP